MIGPASRRGSAARLATSLCVLAIGAGFAAACAPGATPPAPNAASTAAVAATSAATPAARQAVKVMWVAKVANMAPALVAQDAGYFADQGLDVDISFANGSPVGMAALLSGQIDILQAAGTAVVTAAAGTQDPVKQPVQFIGTVNDAVFKLLVDPSISSLNDLKGKTLCTSRPGTADDISLRLYLQRQHFDIKDVSVIASGSIEGCAASLQAHQTAGSLVSTPFTALLEGHGFRVLVDFARERIKLQQLGVATTAGYVQAHPDILLRFTRAYIQGIHRFKTDKPFAEDVLRKYMDIVDQTQLDDGYETYRTVFEEDPLPNAEAFQNVIDAVPEAQKVTPQQVMELKFVRQLESEGFITSVYGH